MFLASDDAQPVPAPPETAAAVIAQFGPDATPRLRAIVARVVHHLHELVRELEPTEEEWLAAIAFLNAVGHASDGRRDEMIMLSDTLGVSALVDSINHRKLADDATESTVLGPFFIEGAAARPLGDAVVDPRHGEPAVVAGKVTDEAGRPIAGATLDVWQTDGRGLYDVQRGEDGATRAKFRTGADGGFWFRTVKPVSYPVPTDGPAGRLLLALGRPVTRPAHIHFMVRARGHVPLTTHLFVAGDPHLGADPVFGVKTSLVVPFATVHDPAEAARWNVMAPFAMVRQDFVLQAARLPTA